MRIRTRVSTRRAGAGGGSRAAQAGVRLASRVGEVLVADDPLAVLGQQGEERAFGQRADQLGRVKETHLARRRREHARMVPGEPDGPRVFFSGLLGLWLLRRRLSLRLLLLLRQLGLRAAALALQRCQRAA